MGIKPGFKQTEVGVIPADWDVRPLSEIAQDGSPICYGIVQVGPFVENGIPVLAIKNLNRDYVSNIHQASVEVERLYARSRVQPDDVVISVKGTTGRVGIVPKHFIGNISRDIARVRLKEDVDPKYVYHMLQSGLSQNRLNSAAVGTTRMELSISILKDVCIPIPPTKFEQEAITEPLSHADALIESLERLLAKKRHFKQGAMQELLTGKKRLPGYGKEWERVKVGDVIQKYFCGPSPTCEERNIVNEEEWGVLKTTAITWENGWDWTKHKTLPRIFWNRPDQEVIAGDVIVTKAGPRHRVGVTCWVDFSPGRIVVSGKMIALRPNPEKAVPFMLSAAISARDTQEFLNQRTTGMAESQVNFENEALIQAPILLPRLGEQVAITSILTDLDADITTLENKLAKARQLKTGMMQELLTGRIRLGRSSATVMPFVAEQKAAVASSNAHNPQINEAVVLAVLASKFGTEQYPLARVRRTKMMYLLHRHVEHQTTGFLKKAAGPYNPQTRYGGPEKIAMKNHYVRVHHNGTYEGFVPAERKAQAEEYFEKWYGSSVMEWMEQFRHKRTDELELLATIDMACEDLRREGKATSLSAVKHVLQSNAEWKAKLDKPVFSDQKIDAAIEICKRIFPPEGENA